MPHFQKQITSVRLRSFPLLRILRFLALALAAMFLPGASASAQQKAPLVLAAASLQESLTDAANRWAKLGHARPVISFAASSALARQIEAGAPADLFISADQEWMDDVATKGLIAPHSRAALVANRLVQIAPDSSQRVLAIRPGFPLAQSLGAGRLAVADPDSVPAGRYAKAALVKLGIWKSVEGKLARAENVRAALALVARGEAPFGIVYATDALVSRDVRGVGFFPANSHPPIIYPIARLKTSKHPEAEGFRRYLLSPAGKAIFTAYGFQTR